MSAWARASRKPDIAAMFKHMGEAMARSCSEQIFEHTERDEALKGNNTCLGGGSSTPTVYKLPTALQVSPSSQTKVSRIRSAVRFAPRTLATNFEPRSASDAEGALPYRPIAQSGMHCPRMQRSERHQC